jgi:hypothetical protein
MPLAAKPDVMLEDKFGCSLSNKFFKRPGKTDFRHAIFIGLKTATSNGWHKCVLFGGRNTNKIIFFAFFNNIN